MANTTCASHCGGSCVLKLNLADGAIGHIETDGGKGPQLRACARGRAYRQRIYAPDRLRYPLKRVGQRGEGKFVRISWDAALDTAAQQLKRVRKTYGPASLLYLRMGGDVANLHTGDRMAEVLAQSGGFTEVWGNPSFGGGMYAQWATYGTFHTCNTRDDLVNSRLIIMWGWNPAVTITGVNTNWYLAQAREKGARIIAVDPRYTESAAVFADRWSPIRPGTDGAALLAMAYVMIRDGLQDQAFLDTYTLGYGEFRNYVTGLVDGVAKTPEWAEHITGMPAGEIESLAREFATIKPAALIAGIAPGRTAYGEQYHRLAMTLAAMTGNVGVHGGNAAGRAWESVRGSYPYRISRDSKFVNPVDKNSPDPPGGSFPNYRASRLHYSEVPDALEKGKAGGYPADYRSLCIVNSSYVSSFANVNRITRALKSERLEFILINEQFMTPTARFADIILPNTTYMERSDIVNGVGLAFYGYAGKAVEPSGECKSQLEMASLLALRLGIDPPGGQSEDDRLRSMARNSEISDYEAFRRQGVHRIEFDRPYVALEKQIASPAHNPFPTPSGKIEIYSQNWARLDRADLPPVPRFIPAWEGRTDPLANKYPLQMISTHFRPRANCQFDNIPWLREIGRQSVLISPVDAGNRGIENGDAVFVYNDRGRIRTAAMVTERIMPGVVDVFHGAWFNPDESGVDNGGCPNVLTRDAHSPGWAFPNNSCLVQVEKA